MRLIGVYCNMNVKTKALTYIIQLLIGGLSAFYLVLYLDEITLTTNLQRFFVWCYFEVLVLIFTCFFKCDFIIGLKKHVRKCSIGMLIFCIVLILFDNSLLPQKYLDNELTLTISEEKNNKSQGQEVWINGLKVGSKVVPLSQYANINGWTWDGTALSGSYAKSGVLVIDLPGAKEILLEFGMHQWSGIIEVQSNNEKEIIDLYNDQGANKVVVINGLVEKYGNLYTVLLFLGGISLFVLLEELVLVVVEKRHKEKNKFRK